MSADIKRLRTRIKSVDSTLHMTDAMGLVASSKIRRATESMERARQYADALRETVESLSSYSECRKSPYSAVREGGRDRIVVVAGDRGLAGGYNANVFRLMRSFASADIVPVGKRASDKYGKETVYAEYFTFADAMKIAREAALDFKEGRIDRFGIVCTEYISLMSQEARIVWLLPLVAPDGKAAADAIFEPDPITVLNAAVPDYIAGMIVSLVRESFASEIAARRVAMDSAGKNAREMLSTLGLEYNRARQGSITQEITEIVAGSDA